ncbi:MAG: hypothetical protein EXQ74_06100 [Thermoleophilia bacterium]|nr:hypothetical protein [Thermoleophilia bacterium]
MKTLIKFLMLVGVAALVYWFVRERLAAEPDEFTFTEVTDTVADAAQKSVVDAPDAAAEAA